MSKRSDKDFAEEINAHIALEADRLVNEGMGPDEARAAARRAFGNVTRAQEQFYESRRIMWLDDAVRDVRYAARALARTPRFTLVALLTLALGIGANTAIFSVLDAVLLRPLPYARPSELVSFTPAWYDTFLEWTRGVRSIQASGAYTYALANVTGGDEPVRVYTLAVTSSLLPALGVAPMIGRGFTPEDDVPSPTSRILLRHGFWMDHFGGNPDVVGRIVQLDGHPHEVIGVLPADLEFPPPARRGDGSLPRTADVWTGVGWLDDLHENGGFSAIARLAAGRTRADATAELSAAARASSTLPPLPGRVDISLVAETVVAPVRPALVAFMAGVGLVLLVACANLGNLLLARLTSRRRELAVRMSLGASPGRIARQILAEAAVLALAGAVAGIGVAWLALRSLVVLAPPELIRIQDAALSGRALAVTLAAGIATALMIGVLPALRARLRHPGADLGSTRSTADRTTGRVQAVLVAGEVALAVVLLVGGGLLLRSFAALASVSPGFGADALVTADVLVPEDRYQTRSSVLQFFDQLEGTLAAQPGVRSVSAIDRLPYGPSFSRLFFKIAGRPAAGPHDQPVAFNAAARPGYFRTMGIPILEGREFTPWDAMGSAPVVVVSQALARRYWPGARAIGSRVVVFGVEREIVGIAGDVRHLGPATPVVPLIYLPQAQDIAVRRMMTVVVSTGGAADALLPVLRSDIHSLDRELPVSNLQRFGTLRAERTAAERFNALVLTTFAILALLLAAIGVFGVVSFAVTERTSEIAIRLALGAQRGSVAWLVLGRTLTLGAAGIVAGLGTAAAATQWLTSMLFGLTPLDGVTYVVACALIVLVVAVASYLPVRRAARVDPTTALRCP
jgi:putative ABC transport system permease protein